jgi:hypothetical protein
VTNWHQDRLLLVVRISASNGYAVVTDRARTSFWLVSVPFSRSVATATRVSHEMEVSNRLAGRWRGDPLRYPTHPPSARRLTSGFSDYRRRFAVSTRWPSRPPPRGRKSTVPEGSRSAAAGPAIVQETSRPWTARHIVGPGRAVNRSRPPGFGWPPGAGLPGFP